MCYRAFGGQNVVCYVQQSIMKRCCNTALAGRLILCSIVFDGSGAGIKALLRALITTKSSRPLAHLMCHGAGRARKHRQQSRRHRVALRHLDR